MAYGGVTGFLKLGRSLEEMQFELLRMLEGKSAAEIAGLLIADLPNLIELQAQADRADDLQREVKNLEWNYERLKHALGSDRGSAPKHDDDKAPAE